MNQLFGPTLDEQIQCVRREIELREKVYDRLIRQGRMTPEKADREIESMEAVLGTLEQVRDGR